MEGLTLEEEESIRGWRGIQREEDLQINALYEKTLQEERQNATKWFASLDLGQKIRGKGIVAIAIWHRGITHFEQKSVKFEGDLVEIYGISLEQKQVTLRLTFVDFGNDPVELEPNAKKVLQLGKQLVFVWNPPNKSKWPCFVCKDHGGLRLTIPE